MKCRKCNKGPNEIGGYLTRVNPLGEMGIWECAPSCDADMTPDNRVIAAIENETSEVSSTGLLSEAEVDTEINRFATGLKNGEIGHGMSFIDWMTVYRPFEKVSNFPMGVKCGYKKLLDNVRAE